MQWNFPRSVYDPIALTCIYLHMEAGGSAVFRCLNAASLQKTSYSKRVAIGRYCALHWRLSACLKLYAENVA